MSKFQLHLHLILKHLDSEMDESDSLIRKLADISSLAGLEEQDIIELCELLSDKFDEKWREGISVGRKNI